MEVAAVRPHGEAAPDVVTLGECLVALVATSLGPLAEAATFERHVAGAEANVSVGLARLGHHPVYIGRVGADGFGRAIQRRLTGEGVHTEFLTVDPSAPTGILVRERRALGPAEVIYYRAGSAGSRLEPADVNAAAGGGAFDAARWLHITGITPALSTSARSAIYSAIDRAREARLTISLDVNLRRKLWLSEDEAARVLRELTGRVDIILAGTVEAELVAGTASGASPVELAEGLVALGPSTAVVKLGAQGALGLERGGEPLVRPATQTPVVDTIGAGDGFAAGFIASRLEGTPLERSLDVANACGAAAIAVVGDLTGLPDTTELERLLGEPSPDDSVR